MSFRSSRLIVNVPPRPPAPPSPTASVPVPPSAPDGRRGSAPARGPGLAELVYELLDAHADTADLASGLELDRDWLSHLHYLRALQREGRRVLAEMTAEQSV